MTASPTFKRETEAVGIAVADREAGNCELAFVYDLTCCQRSKLEFVATPDRRAPLFMPANPVTCPART